MTNAAAPQASSALSKGTKWSVPEPNTPTPNKHPKFPKADDELSICAVCLSCHLHRVVECTSPKTWDQQYDTFAKCELKILLTKDGSSPLAVTKIMRITTCVWDAVPQHTVLRAALVLRERAPPIPYKAATWTSLLLSSGLFYRFSKIPSGLWHGFILNFPSVYRTQSLPNKPSIDTYNTEFNESVHKEINKGRYLGPYPLAVIESVLGPFQSSPLSIIPKSGCPGKFRLIQNFSFPLSPSPSHPNPSINSYINADDFPTTWGKFSVVYLLISHLPPGSEAATQDVAEAYCTIPLHQSQWPGAVVRISESLGCIDTFTAFGAMPSAGAYGHLADAGCELMRAHGLRPIEKWVDDHIFFRIRCDYLMEYNTQWASWSEAIKPLGPMTSGSHIWFKGATYVDGSHDEFSESCAFPIKDQLNNSPRSAQDQLFTFNFSNIDALSDTLGIPWEKSKDQLFGPSTIYIGFLWDITKRRVSLSPPKVTKYLLTIKSWQSQSTHVLQDVRELYGKLLHACAAIPCSRSYLTGFEHMLGTCAKKPFLPHHPDKAIITDLLWWVDALSSGAISRPIFPPTPFIDPRAFSDASSGVGLGIIIGNTWRAWHLLPGWQFRDGQKDIGWAESVTFELLVHAIASMANIRGQVIVHGDNTGVVEGWKNGRHCNHATNTMFRQIHSFLLTVPSHLDISTRYVQSEHNPADGPSRGILGPTDTLLPAFPILLELEPFIIDTLSPPSPTELIALQRGQLKRP